MFSIFIWHISHEKKEEESSFLFTNDVSIDTWKSRNEILILSNILKQISRTANKRKLSLFLLAHVFSVHAHFRLKSVLFHLYEANNLTYMYFLYSYWLVLNISGNSYFDWQVFCNKLQLKHLDVRLSVALQLNFKYIYTFISLFTSFLVLQPCFLVSSVLLLVFLSHQAQILINKCMKIYKMNDINKIGYTMS